jgi:tetratricopeptide (TPR) repeat protein
MARETTRTLRQKHGLDIPRPDREAFEEDAEHLIADYFPTIQSHLNEHVLLLTFDEFDTLAQEDIQSSLANPLIAYLRRLMDLEGLSFIFSIGSSGNKLENMQASYTDFFKTALYRKISFLDRVSCWRLITKPVEGDIEYEKGAVNRIYEITAGHPYFTQLTCHELFSLCQKNGSRVISEDDVESVIKDVIERGTVNLKFVWDEASDLEKWVLACLAQLEKGVSNKRLAAMLRDQRVRFVESDLNSAVLHLREKDVLSKDNTFVVYLMRLWLEQNRPLDRVREELTEVNPIANRFIEIGDEYQDREEFESAIESYRQALGADPKNLRANLNLAQTYLKKGEYQEAIEGFEKALNIDPEDVAAQTGLCEAYLALGNREKVQGNEEGAIAYYQKVLTFNESHADARQGLADIYRNRAEGYLAGGKDDQALNAYNQALEYTPEDEDLYATYQEVLAKKKVEVIRGWLQKADRALDRQEWETAIEAVENALKIDPEDEDLQKRLEDVKDASRQHQLGIYQDQIDRTRAAEEWDKAIETLQKAIQLAPEEDYYKDQLEEVQEAQRQAQLDAFQREADRALEEEDWDAAVQALRGAEELEPDDPIWEERIEEVEKQRFQAQLDDLRSKAESAKKEEDWGSAIAALQEYLELEPSQEIHKEIEDLKERQRQSRLAALKSKAERAEDEERWPDAIEQWEAHLALDPDDARAAKGAVQRAQKYKQIYEDYQQARESLRQKRYGQAVELLQGIIAQDPTYKATSRLLVEAVEAREDVPLWKKPWLYAAVGVVLVVVAGFLFGPRFQKSEWFKGLKLGSGIGNETAIQTMEGNSAAVENMETLTATYTIIVDHETPSGTRFSEVDVKTTLEQSPAPTETPTPEPPPPPIQTVLSYIEGHDPAFEDDFSSPKPEWGSFENRYGVDTGVERYWQPISEVVYDGVLHVEGVPNKEGDYFHINFAPEQPAFQAYNFVLEYEYMVENWSSLSESTGEHGVMIRWDGGDHIAVMIALEEDKAAMYNPNPNGNVWHQEKQHAGIAGKTAAKFKVIAYGEDIALYVDDNLILNCKNRDITGTQNKIRIAGESYRLLIDNVRFWNLDGVDLETAEATPTPTPTPKTPTPTPTSESSSSSLKAGSTQVSPVDGMTLVYVPEGGFIMGNNDDSGFCGDPSNCPEHEVYLDAFWIDQTEVTNAMYAKFLNEQGVELDGDNYIDIENDFIERRDGIWQPKIGKEDYPVIEVTWPGVKAYCEWAGRQLPTEAKWEKSSPRARWENIPMGRILVSN